MTVNYTSLLALGQPVTGTESGTWGDDVNNAVTSYLDIAIAGTLTLTGDGAVTLANTQGTNTATNISSTTAQYAILKIVGPLTATKVITAPSTSKTYLVINTDSTYDVTVKASGQTGVNVAAGARAFVVFNGTDYVIAANSNANNSTSPFTGPDGTAGAPTYSFNSSGNSDNGMYLSAANELSWATSGTKYLTLTSNGRFYGTALHNNAGSVTGTTNQYIASGTYSPTFTALVNCTVSPRGTNTAQWMRVGNVVTVSGWMQVDPTSGTSGTLTRWSISLPIASSIGTNNEGCFGVTTNGYDSGPIYASTNVAVADTQLINSGASQQIWSYTFTYLML